MESKKSLFLFAFLSFFLILLNIDIIYASESMTIYKAPEKRESNMYYTDGNGNEKKMPLYDFTNEDGSKSLCLQSGLDGAEVEGSTYYKDNDFDVSSCSKNWTNNCGLASIIAAGTAQNVSYGALETALRLYNAYSADPSSYVHGTDGAYDDTTGLTSRENIYYATAEAAVEYGYDGKTMSSQVAGLENVLYVKDNGDNSSLTSSDLAAGIALFKDALNRSESNTGMYGWAPSVNLVSSERDSSGRFTFTLSTNFNSATELDIPSEISGYPTTVSKNCTDSGCTIYISVTPPSSTECVSLDFDISFLDSRYSMGSIQKYEAAGARRQEFLTYSSTPGGGNYPISDEWCETDGEDCCNDMRIQDNIPMSCDTSSEGSVEDPEMCTIIKSCDSGKKSSYDFTEMAGLNEKYCSLFCREKIEFTFMDKTEVIAGRQFKYDVSSRYNVTQMLSTVILGTRECMSPEIKYDQWEKDYLEADAAVIVAWNNLKFWEAIYINTGGGVPTDIIETPNSSDNCCGRHGKGIWNWMYIWSGPWKYNGCDLVGGNSVSCSPKDAEAFDAGIIADSWDTTCCGYDTDGKCINSCCIGCGEQDATSGNPGLVASSYTEAVRNYKAALEKREKLLMDIQNCNLLSYSNFTYIPQTYDMGEAGSYRYNFGETDTAYYKVVSDYDFHSIVDITYEDQYSPLINIQEDNPIQISTNNYFCKDCDYDSYCGGCGNEPKLGAISTKNDLRRIVCSGQETGANCEVINTVVPDNNAAMVTTSKEQHFWQSAKFHTQLYTGTVSTSPNGQGWWIGLDDYIYPIELNKKNGSYGVYVDISNIGAASRPQNIKISDKEFECAFNVINETTMYECDPEDTNCYIECDPTEEVCDDYGEGKTGLGMVVRSVDLSNLFPNNRTVGMNWKNSEKVIKSIQNLGDNIWTSKSPQYVIELSPSNIRNIRNYNKYMDYMDYSLSCDSSYNCISEFLTDLSSKNYSYNFDLPARNKTTDEYGNFYKYNRGDY